MKKIIIFLTMLLIVILSSVLYLKHPLKSDVATQKNNIIKENTTAQTSIENILTELTSNKFLPRAITEQGNIEMISYLNQLCSKLNLSFVFNDSYLHEFNYSFNEFNLITEKEESKNIISNNIIGKIKGKNSNNAIIFTAHFDGFGKSILDNLSGCATLIRMIENINAQNIIPQNDIIIAFTNAEMSGFWGSKALVDDISTQYTKMYNINLDCIGLKNGGSLALQNISKVEESTQLYDYTKKELEKYNIKYENVISSKKLERRLKENRGVSDYISFEHKNIPNLHLAQSNFGNIVDRENEGIETIDFLELEKIAQALADLAINYQ